MSHAAILHGAMPKNDNLNVQQKKRRQE